MSDYIDYINIGPTPADEGCLPAGHPRARQENRIYLVQLQREFPEARLMIKSFPHDFGTYYEVVAVYSEEEQEKIALRVKEEASPVWSEESRIALELLKQEAK